MEMDMFISASSSDLHTERTIAFFVGNLGWFSVLSEPDIDQSYRIFILYLKCLGEMGSHEYIKFWKSSVFFIGFGCVQYISCCWG